MTGVGGSVTAPDDLPNVFVHDGHIETMLIARPGWLLVASHGVV